MPLVFRVMLAESDGKPVVGDRKKMLGVRPGFPPQGDIPVTSEANVNQGTGGLSVAPDWKQLPHFLIPRRLRHLAPRASGKNDDSRCYRIGEGPFAESEVANGLRLRIEDRSHGLIEPSHQMLLTEYQRLLANTRDQWEIDES